MAFCLLLQILILTEGVGRRFAGFLICPLVSFLQRDLGLILCSLFWVIGICCGGFGF